MRLKTKGPSTFLQLPVEQEVAEGDQALHQPAAEEAHHGDEAAHQHRPGVGNQAGESAENSQGAGSRGTG